MSPVANVVLGVALGATLSLLATLFLENTRNRRQMKIRWDERKYDAFSSYLKAVVTMGRLAGQAAGARGWKDRTAKVELSVVEDAIEKAEAERSAAFEQVYLAGHLSTIEAGKKLNEWLWVMEWLATGRRPGSTQAWENARRGYLRQLDEFHLVMRNDLRVPGHTRDEVVSTPSASVVDQVEQRFDDQ